MLAALWRIVAHDFPRAVRADAGYVWLADRAAHGAHARLGRARVLPARADLVGRRRSDGGAVGADVLDDGESIGRTRMAGDDWTMFGFYISNNVGIAFQCFASGLAAGVGSIFFLVYNGAMFGAVAGYLAERGLGDTFFSFVVTHGSFELTAIVLSGAAGLKLGHSLLKPGRRTRGQSLVFAASECVVIVYGVTAMLIVAAARRGVLVVVVLGAAQREVRRRGGVLVGSVRVSRIAGPPMQLDALALRMRPRAPLEAADLGARLCQRMARSVYACYAHRLRAGRRLAAAIYEIATWLPTLVLFFAKPWLDRTILFVLSRAAFGQTRRCGSSGKRGGKCGGAAVADLDLAALVAVAFVHAARLSARRLAVRKDSSPRRCSCARRKRGARC